MRPFSRGGTVIRTVPAFVALVLACMLVPTSARAGYRGAFDPLTSESNVWNRYQSPVYRPVPEEDGIEFYFSFTTRSPVVGHEACREIWLHQNVSRAGLVMDLEEARQPLLRDLTGRVSYLDPAWSPDGRFLAYVKTDAIGSNMEIDVQEFEVSDDIFEASTPVGDPIVVVPSAPNSSTRSPNWNPDGTTLAFASTRSGVTWDVYTVQVFPALGPLVRQTMDDAHAEMSPAWAPDGQRIAYETNYFGTLTIAIVDLATPAPHTWRFAEVNAAPVIHSHPSWSSDGLSIYYHAPKNEDPEQLPDIWKLDLATGAKCAISIDRTDDSEVDVSHYTQTSPDGVPFNYFLFTSMAGYPMFLGPNTWRGEMIFNCVPPLKMGVKITPDPFTFGGPEETVTATLSFPPETSTLGYQSTSFDGPKEGIRMRATILPSPTLNGLLPLTTEPDGPTPIFTDRKQAGKPVIDVEWDRAEFEDMLRSNGLVGNHVPIIVDGYSNGVGRAFRGIAYIKVFPEEALAASAVSLQQNAPNPFNPQTTIRFSTGGAGVVTVRIFSAQGRLIRALGGAWYPQGTHSVGWDGKDGRGHDVPSGVYYAKASTAAGTQDRIKMTLLR